MFQHGAHEVRFAVGFGGYAREPVDSLVEQCELSMSETRAQLQRTAQDVVEADRRVQAMEARVSELEGGETSGSWITELANELLDKAREVGSELQGKVVSEAKAESQRLKQTVAAEPDKAARARAEEMVTKARSDSEELAGLVEESRRQVAELLQEGRTMAEEQARVRWEKSRDRLHDAVLELGRLHEQRRTLLKEVMELEELLDESWSRALNMPPPTLQKGEPD